MNVTVGSIHLQERLRESMSDDDKVKLIRNLMIEEFRCAINNLADHFYFCGYKTFSGNSGNW